MGDTYENITNSTIINRSSLENAFNQIKEQVDEETANALIQVAEIVGQSNNPAAGVLLTSFTDEVKSKEPDKSKLSQYWNGLVTLLPSVATLSTACAKIIPLFLMSLDEFNSWQETLYLLSNPANAEHLRKSIEQANSGKKTVRALIEE
jgi:antitoxin YefM